MRTDNKQCQITVVLSYFTGYNMVDSLHLCCIFRLYDFIGVEKPMVICAVTR
jgi:hypothetical protein